jgi:hypothetical protein
MTVVLPDRSAQGIVVCRRRRRVTLPVQLSGSVDVVDPERR